MIRAMTVAGPSTPCKPRASGDDPHFNFTRPDDNK